jgi:hypothetical protein
MHADMFATKLKTQQSREQQLLLFQKQLDYGIEAETMNLAGMGASNIRPNRPQQQGFVPHGLRDHLMGTKEEARNGSGDSTITMPTAVVRTQSASTALQSSPAASAHVALARTALLVQRPTWPLIRPVAAALAAAADAGVEEEGRYDNILGEDGLAADVGEFSRKIGEARKKTSPSSKVKCLKKRGWVAYLRSTGNSASLTESADPDTVLG